MVATARRNSPNNRLFQPLHLFLQVVQQVAVPQQQQGLGTPGSMPQAAAARQLDPQVQALGPSHTPVSVPAAPRGTGLAKPAISWASVVQVSRFCF